MLNTIIPSRCGLTSERLKHGQTGLHGGILYFGLKHVCSTIFTEITAVMQLIEGIMMMPTYEAGPSFPSS
jgi:hypothetical protein